MAGRLTGTGMDPDLFGSITVSVGRISDIHPLNKMWSAWVEPLTLAGSWPPSSLSMNLGRGQWLIFFPDHPRPCHLCTSAIKAYFLMTILGSKWMACLGPWSEGFSSMMLVHLVHFLTVLGLKWKPVKRTVRRMVYFERFGPC